MLCAIITEQGDDSMPLISSFFGILIYMFKELNSEVIKIKGLEG